MDGKIAVEEHFVPGDSEDLISAIGWSEEDWRRVVDRLKDTDFRIEQMDRLGVEKQILSLGAFGIQDVVDAEDAARRAREGNESLAEFVRRRPDRFAGYAALPMQDPAAAAEEVRYAVTELGFVGAMVNGYSSLGDLETGVYYDGEEFLPFWEAVAGLGVPFYLHPRNPLPNQRRIYEGRSELLGPAWAFAVETGTHALRLITSGLFDRFPNLTIVIGHLGEFLPFAMNRLEQRISHQPHVNLRRTPTQILRENFYVSTSGNNHTASFIGVMLEIGADRLLFASDYPFEEMHDGTTWFDNLAISETDRVKVGRTNAKRLFGI